MAYTKSANLPIDSEQVGIAITHGAFGSHLGIAYCDESGTARLLHLAWHKRLVIESYPAENWLASILVLPPLASSQAVALVRGMGEKYGNKSNAEGIDYGINLFAGHGAIKQDGEYAPGPDCDGFTCASIIAEALAKVGFRLVKLDTWVEAPKNLAWGRAIVCVLRATHTPNIHIEKVESNIKGLRLLPEEVAAAAELAPDLRPASHGDIQERSAQIIAQMQQSCSPPPEPGDHYKHCVDEYRAELERLDGKL